MENKSKWFLSYAEQKASIGGGNIQNFGNLRVSVHPLIWEKDANLCHGYERFTVISFQKLEDDQC